MRRKRRIPHKKPRAAEPPTMTDAMKAAALEEWLDLDQTWPGKSADWKIEAVSARLNSLYGFVFDYADIRAALPEGTIL